MRNNISFPATMLKQAKELKAAGYATTFSGVIQRAVDEAWGRRSPKTAAKKPAKKKKPAAHEHILVVPAQKKQNN